MRRTTFDKTRPSAVSVGLRKAPEPNGQPGFLRVDTVHQGDRNGVKGIYLINLVDQTTQFELVAGATCSRHTNISSHGKWGDVLRWPGAPRPVHRPWRSDEGAAVGVPGGLGLRVSSFGVCANRAGAPLRNASKGCAATDREGRREANARPTPPPPQRAPKPRHAPRRATCSRHTNISSHGKWGDVLRWPGAPRPVHRPWRSDEGAAVGVPGGLGLRVSSFGVCANRAGAPLRNASKGCAATDREGRREANARPTPPPPQRAPKPRHAPRRRCAKSSCRT